MSKTVDTGNTSSAAQPNESIADLYARLEADDKSRAGSRGEKSEKVRTMVKDIAKETGKKELLLATVYKMCEAKFVEEGDKLDRPHFTQVVEKAFGTKKVDGRLWITMDGSGKKPTSKKKKAAPTKTPSSVTADDIGDI